MFIDEISELRQSITRLVAVIEGMDGGLHASVPNASRGVQNVLPIGYLPSSFRFPLGLTADDCWQRWHGKERPLRTITVKMLPDTLSLADRARQCTLRRKMKGVMEILQGTTPNKTVDIDVDFVWKACWAQCVTLFGIREPCSLVVTTLYDWLLKQPDKVKQARAAPPIALHEAANAAAEIATTTARAAARLAAAVAATPPVRSAAAAAVADTPPVRSAAAGGAAVPLLPESLAAAGQQPLTVSPHVAAAMVQLQVLDAQISHVEQAPNLPDKGVRCKHCKKILTDIKTARKHHTTCEALKHLTPAAPCASWTGCRLDDICFDISLAARVGPRHHLAFDHSASDAALRRFQAAEAYVASNQAPSAAAAAALLLYRARE